MAKTLYSWTTFPRSDVHPKEHIKVGQKVTKKDFDYLEDDQFEELLATGAIRETPYPIPQRDDGSFVHSGSPREYMLSQIAADNEAQYDPSYIPTRNVPQLQEAAKAAADAAGMDIEVPDDEQTAAQNDAEEGQASRSITEATGRLSGTAGKK